MLAIGIGSLIFVELTINVAMVLGILLVVGMPLPFFSYGGSSMVTICVRLGLLIAIDRIVCGNRIALKNTASDITGRKAEHGFSRFGRRWHRASWVGTGAGLARC
jgi:hypothetical protein